ncbi:MAG: lytic transglycosylase domain-containing protein [Bdellovibrionales bacterium]|nr:lytic transglycosylase domain-containing protein [Bdellovibrionales bacterium]
MFPRDVNGTFDRRVKSRFSPFRSALFYFVAGGSLVAFLFVCVLNLPDNSRPRELAETSLRTAWDRLEELYWQAFPADAEEVSRIETVPDTLANEAAAEPLVLEDSTTGWFENLDIDLGALAFFTDGAPLVDPDPFPRLQTLNDPLARIGTDFKIPPRLYERTRFWFDIYTKYDSSVHVIHHTRYPWIVYSVVDTRQLIAEGRGPLWLRRERALKHVKQEKIRIVRTLRNLASRSSFKRLSGLEAELFQALSKAPGSRRQALRLASRTVRSQLGQKDFFLSGLHASGEYLPHMEEIFKAQGLPVELTRMPFVESSFNVRAESKVGASGIWQIMPRTGRSFMIVTDQIDERNSPLKATRAAARILRRYNHALRSWPLTITGYNHGIGGVLRATRIAQSRDLPTIINRYHSGSFRFASSNFYTCFLAALYAERYHDKIFREVPRAPLMKFRAVRLTAGKRLNQVLQSTGLDRAELLSFNIDLRGTASRNPFLPRGFEVYLPTSVDMNVANKLGKVDSPTKGRPRSASLVREKPRG